MSLKDDVTVVFKRLAPFWSDTFRRAGLEFDPAKLDALQQPLARIDRCVPGFEDFAPQATRAIEPGDPAFSLIYHALASPNVHPTHDGAPAADEAYPSLPELDLIENYICALKPFDTQTLPGLVVAMFAYEYRPAASTGHRTHADLVYSRTGVARIGSEAMAWSAAARCFLNQAPGRRGSFAVMPARYGVFLAETREANAANISLVGQWDDDDEGTQFLYPVRKLFDGADCIAGLDLAVEVEEYHRAEKLRRVFTVGGRTLKDGFDIDAAPLLRESGQAEPLVRLERVRGSVLISSPPAPLVRYATQRNARSNAVETVSFEVPSSGPFFKDFSINRHYTTLMLVEDWFTLAPELLIGSISDAHPRIAPRNVPNFVNIRHEVRDPAKPPVDLGEPGAIPAGKDYRGYIAEGGYQAALFEDSICDGSVWAKVAGLPGAPETRAAFSVVAAPDFFAYADELHLNNHSEVVADQFSSGGPAPLCEGRYRVNPAVLERAAGGKDSRDLDDHTLVAIVGRPKEPATSIQPSRERGNLVGQWARTTSYLTDAASNQFAPGWDVTFGGSIWKKFYTTYGLGSPFPEDVKLCAASNSFWPAAAPDASRTFDRKSTPTAIPMLDQELGYHPRNPDKPPNASTETGWDGEYGPFFEYVDGKRIVNVCDIWRSDYVSNAGKGWFKPDPFLTIGSDELIARMKCLRLCIQSLPESPKAVKDTKLWLVTAQRVDDWSSVPNHHTLSGPGYKYVFARPTDDEPMAVPRDEKWIPGDEKRVRQTIAPTGYVCHVTPELLYWSTDGNTFAAARP